MLISLARRSLACLVVASREDWRVGGSRAESPPDPFCHSAAKSLHHRRTDRPQERAATRIRFRSPSSVAYVIKGRPVCHRVSYDAKMLTEPILRLQARR